MHSHAATKFRCCFGVASSLIVVTPIAMLMPRKKRASGLSMLCRQCLRHLLRCIRHAFSDKEIQSAFLQDHAGFFGIRSL